MKRSVIYIATLGLVPVVACSESIAPTSLEMAAPPTPSFAWNCTDPSNPYCIPGPSADPDPTQPGHWIGIGGEPMTDDWCMSNGGDGDQDGVDDLCEFLLAYTFRPLMRSYQLDDVDGEPYWAMQRIAIAYPFPLNQTLDPNPYRIIYMLAYYDDFGVGCNPFGCDHGHVGDSEFIILDVVYHAPTEHWVAQVARPSAHWGGLNDRTIFIPQSQLQFEEHRGWYPTFYVSKSKHANFESRRACNADFTRADKCIIPFVSWRPEVTMYNNVGSIAAPAPDVPFNRWGNVHTCVQSRDENLRLYYGWDQPECFWKPGERFAGWRNAPGVTGYHEILTSFGFDDTGGVAF